MRCSRPSLPISRSLLVNDNESSCHQENFLGSLKASHFLLSSSSAIITKTTATTTKTRKLTAAQMSNVVTEASAPPSPWAGTRKFKKLLYRRCGFLAPARVHLSTYYALYVQ